MHFGKTYICDPEYGAVTVAGRTHARLAAGGAGRLDGA